MSEWNPGIGFRTLKGRSAIQYAMITVVSGPFLALAGFTSLGLMLIFGNAFMDSLWAIPMMLLMLVSGGVTGGASAAYEVRLKQEARAGYATARNRPLDLAEVDWRSGRVIRLPGEPRLSPDEHRRRTLLVRAHDRAGRDEDGGVDEMSES